MAIIQYTPESLAPDSQVSLSQISEYGLQAKAMLAALGDYWTAYYRDIGPISSAMTGAVAAYSREYTHLLDMVRAANILDIPITDTDQFELLVFDREDFQPVYAEDGSLDHYFVAKPDIASTEFFTTSLFESPVVLEHGRHFEVVKDKGYRFYVDIFNDPNIVGYVYSVGEDTVHQVLLWACDIALSSTIIYNRYGRFLYRKALDSEQYKWMVSALMVFYENAKTTKCIQNVMNIMYGVPYTRYKDEVITEISYVDKNLQPISELTEEPYICIATDRARYYTYTFSDLVYQVGDVVPQFALLASINRVEDYIDTPNWWLDAAFADDLIAGGSDLTIEQKNELMDKVLKYNTVHINIGVSYDTYKTYLAQVREFFNIIEGGFPVYLYPVVDSIFKAVFIDKVDMEEEFTILKASMQMVTFYDWGNPAKYDGQHNYYMQPEITHGEGLAPQEIRFDGLTGYTYQDLLQARYPTASTFAAQHCYNSGWALSHDHSNEIFEITRLGYSVTDEYPWGTSEHLQAYTAPKYNGAHTANGSREFGHALTMLESEHLGMVIRMAPITEAFPEPRDDADVSVRILADSTEYLLGDESSYYTGARRFSGFTLPAGSYLSERLAIPGIPEVASDVALDGPEYMTFDAASCFSGTRTYSGFAVSQEGCLSEEFSVTITRRTP